MTAASKVDLTRFGPTRRCSTTVEPAVVVSGLHAGYGAQPVLRGVDLSVGTGETLGIIGPNGAGKTTLLKALAGITPSEGRIRLAGAPLTGIDRRGAARLVAMVPQRPLVPYGMTVRDYVLMGRTPHIPRFGLESPADMAVVDDVLARLDLTAFDARRLQSLSGGELQRAVVGRALAQAAPILLLDEPTAALDIGHQQQLLALVDSLRLERGLTVLAAIHDLTLAGQFCDRLALLHEGQFLVTAAPREVLRESVLRRVFGASVSVIEAPDGTLVVVPRGVAS